jgi:hypothetical protein
MSATSPGADVRPYDQRRFKRQKQQCSSERPPRKSWSLQRDSSIHVQASAGALDSNQSKAAPSASEFSRLQLEALSFDHAKFCDSNRTRVFMYEPAGRPRFASLALLCSAFAAASASEMAALIAKQFADLVVGPAAPSVPEPKWTTSHKIALKLKIVRLRDFSTGNNGPPVLMCAPFALHGAAIADLAPGHNSKCGCGGRRASSEGKSHASAQFNRAQSITVSGGKAGFAKRQDHPACWHCFRGCITSETPHGSARCSAFRLGRQR